MTKSEKEQDEEIEQLLEKGFKKYHARPANQSKCSALLIVATIVLLGLTVAAVFLLLQSNHAQMMSKERIIMKSFIDKTPPPELPAKESNIIKPAIDNKSYKAFKLPNGMKILAISDPDSVQGSAAVNVRVGSFADPAEMGGLAHFCEHMVFMESKKYPELNGFQAFVSKYNGDTNAFTQVEDTNYYFQTTLTGFDEAIDRFAGFFINPIFTEDLMSQEVPSIDGELNKNLNDGGWRLRFLLELVSNPASVMHKFTIGSTESLMTKPKENGIDVVAKLKDFFNKYYSANTMSLVMMANKPLEELEALATKAFSDVPNKHATPPTFFEVPGPFSGEYGHKLVQYVPVDPSASVQLLFSVKSSSADPFLDPYSFFSEMISSKGEGSLISLLSKKDLATDIGAGLMVNSDEFQIYLIQLQLSDKGMENVEEVTKIVFAYLDLIREKGINEDLYRQYSKINNYTFNYIPNDGDMMQRLSAIANNLQVIPLEYSVSGSSVTNKFDKKALTEYARQLNPDNMILLVANSNFTTASHPTDTHNKDLIQITSQYKKKYYLKGKEESDKLTYKELDLFNSVYGIHYTFSDLPTKLLDELHQVTYKDYPELKLPKKNKYVPNNFDLVEKGCSNGNLKCQDLYEADALQKEPKMIYEDDYIRVWHQLDRSSKSPMIVGDIFLYSDQIQKNIVAATLGQFKVELIKLLLEEELYDMGLAGNSVEVGANALKIEAFSDVFPEVMSTVLKKYKNLEFDEEKFNLAKDYLSSKLYFGLTDEPYKIPLKYKSKLLLEHNFLETELFEVAQEVNYEDYKELVKDIDPSLFVEVLFIGNILEPQAKALGQEIVKTLNYVPSKQDSLLENKVLNLTGQNLVFRSFSPIDEGNESFILNVYQDGILTPESASYMNLLVNLMEMEVYTYLRTEQQICYLVQTYPDKTKNILSLNILVESPTLNPNEIDEQIEIALQRTEKKLLNLTDQDFATMVDSFELTMKDKTTSLHDKAEGYLGHIVNQDYIFDLRQRILDFIPSVTKNGLIEYFNKLVKTPRKLSIQFYNDGFKELPADTLPKQKELSKSHAKLITNLETLSSLGRYPGAAEAEKFQKTK